MDLENNNISSLIYEDWLVFQRTGLPVFIYLVILCVFGILGNVHVLILFMFKYNESTRKTFILSLASVDLLACGFCVPSTLYMVHHPFTVESTTLCKISRAMSFFTCGTSLLLLDVIAVERCWKICLPLKPKISVRNTKLFCAAVFIFTFLALFVPALVFNDINARKTPYRNLTGSQCSFGDQYINQTDFKIYSGIVFFIFVMMILLCSLMYILIFKKLSSKKHLHQKIHYNVSVSTDGFKDDTVISQQATEMTLIRPYRSDNGRLKTSEINYSTQLSSDSSQTIKNSKGSKIKRAKRKVVIFLVVSLFSYGSFVPLLAAFAARATFKDIYENLLTNYRTLHEFLAWGIFFNNAINPLVYAFMDYEFRQKSYHFVKNCHLCR